MQLNDNNTKTLVAIYESYPKRSSVTKIVKTTKLKKYLVYSALRELEILNLASRTKADGVYLLKTGLERVNPT